MDAMNEIIEGNPDEIRRSEQETEQAEPVDQIEQAEQADTQAEAEPAAPIAAPSEPKEDPKPAAPTRVGPAEPEVLKARVEEIYDDRVIVQIETGEMATIVTKSLTADAIANPSEVVALGEEIYVVLEKHSRGSDTLFASKRQADRLLLWKRLEQAKETGETVLGKVTEAVKGGLVVDIGVRGFVPASQVGRRFVEDLSTYVGEELKLKVREVERLRSNVVLSQRDFLEEQEKLAREHMFETLERGQVILGTVTRLAVFGAFVDIGDGVEGLLHISDISWSRIKHPGEVLAENQQVEVIILNVDRERQRISLGYKQLQPDPWENVSKTFPVGSVVSGTVTKLVEFGAFVSLAEGIEGLVHISQLADRRVARPDEVVSVGDTVTVKVIGLREQEHRISLSIRQALEEGERNEYRKYMKDNRADDGVTIGDRIAYDPSKFKGGAEEHDE
jgi:4-hydroxy-3-methylbut-2-enyl diphosphate reductase